MEQENLIKHFKLERIIHLKGILRCKEGIHIGGTKEFSEIGDIENPVIKNPLTNLPYIPGSSIKGKCRSYLEKKYKGTDGGPYGGEAKEKLKNGEPCNCGKCFVCKLFGHTNSKGTTGPTRLLFRDCEMTEEWQKKYKRVMEQKGPSVFEIKTETAIDRRSGTAMRGSLRKYERVPPGTEFDFELTVRIFEGDDEDKLIEKVEEMLKALNNEGIGGSVSRGSGRVEFVDDLEEMDEYPPPRIKQKDKNEINKN